MSDAFKAAEELVNSEAPGALASYVLPGGVVVVARGTLARCLADFAANHRAPAERRRGEPTREEKQCPR